MGRRLFTLAAAVSLIAMLLVCAVWATTYQHGWGATWIRPDNGNAARWVDFRVSRGDVEIMSCFANHGPWRPTPTVGFTIGWYGMSWMRYYQNGSGHDKLHFYDSHLACALAILPIIWLAAVVYRSRSSWPECACPSCGYDLRASNTRCPECGTPIPDKR